MRKEIRAERIVNLLTAGYSGFLVRTTESKRAAEVLTKIITEIKRLDGKEYHVEQWDFDTAASPPPGGKASSKPGDPNKPLVDLASKNTQDCTVLILHNYHWFLDKFPCIQKIQNLMETWQNSGKAIIILSPSTEIPIEIRKDFMILEMPLPNEAEIMNSVKFISKSAKKEVSELTEGKDEEIIQACKGMTKSEIENVLSLCYIEKHKFDVRTINEQKIQTIEKSGIIEVMVTNKNYDHILGYDRIKLVTTRMIKKRTSKGILIVGPPGCGKTLFMECTVGEFNKIGLIINFGRLYSKWQGEGSSNVEEIIDIIEAIGDCVVVMDKLLSI